MLFDKQWFQKWQPVLLWFANSWIGRKVLCLDKSSVSKNKIIHIEPNAIWWRSGRKVTAEFRTHDKFGKRLFYAFLPFWYLLHYWDTLFANNFAPALNLGFDTLTAYPVAGANSPVDGYVARNLVSESFATIRAGAGVGAGVSDTTITAYLIGSTTTNEYTELYRNIFCFDISSIPAGSTISAGVNTLSLFGTEKTNTLGTPVLHVSGATPANTNNLVAADYGQLQTTSFGTKAYADFSITGYNDITGNSSFDTQLTNAIGAVVKFGTQLSWDILNDATGLSWASGGVSNFRYNTADQAGTTNDPKLVVTYTPVGGISGYKSLLGVGQA